ncbi:MAG: sensor protein [Gemmatimonadetes bacterium]|nr:sensor protein [Gemmatimonadota bacterium]
MSASLAPEVTPAVERSSAVALLTPTGRDADVAALVLGREGVETRACACIEDLCGAMEHGLGAVLVAEEALASRARDQLLRSLRAQPSWSSLPVVVLTGEGELSRQIPAGLQEIATQPNVTLLERPVRVATLLTSLRSALEDRRRQFDLRDQLVERQRREQALVESESRLRDAVDAVPYPMMLHTEDGEILQLSSAWLRLTGYPPRALRTIEDWTSRALDGKPMAGDAWTVRTEGGELRSWDVHSVPLGALPDGRWLQLTAAVDVTDYRELLESEREARGAAESANKAKAEFLAMMSHELRTPLNAIAGYSELLAMGVRGPINDAQLEDLRRIDRNQRHLLSLINDILNYAKIEAGHVEFDLAPVRVRDILRSVEPLIAPQLDAKRIFYEDRGRECDAVVRTDEEKARQIVINVLSNAIKFTGPGGIIVAECRTTHDTACVTITDSGMGIPSDKLEAIFEPFVQVERGFSSSHEGTGLGLSISRDLARQMGGDLTAESALGEGATFSFTLPLAESRD